MNHHYFSPANQSQRQVSLDLIKGLGILEFICWHIFESFYEHPNVTAVMYRIVFSVTGFFVFSSGFIIGSHYYGILQLSEGKNPIPIFKRLCFRASKLLLIVLLANLFMIFVKNKEFSLENVMDVLWKIFSLFFIDRWDVSLQVLMAVAITLTTGFLLLILIDRLRYTLKIFSVILVLLITIDLFMDNNIPYLWRYGLHGIFGVTVGVFFFQNIFSKKFSIQFIKFFGFIFLCLFFTILGIVALVPPTYDFFLYNLGPDLLAVSAYFIGFMNLFYLLYDIEKKRLGWIGKNVENLGKQSLFVYLIQIILINLILLLFKEFNLNSQWECFLLSVLIVVVCSALCNFVDYIRKYYFIDRLYRTIFQ